MEKTPETKTVAETDNFLAWSVNDDGEKSYHLELNNVTLHFFEDEWEEFLALASQIVSRSALN